MSVPGVLHIVRGQLPGAVVKPGDAVIYTETAAPADPVHPRCDHRVWHLEADDQTAVSTDELCRLIFAADRVVVW